MESSFRRAAQSWSKGQKAHAGILSDEGRTYRKRRKLARLRDSNAIFQTNNPPQYRQQQQHVTSCSVDLHGLHQSEAIDRVRTAIASFQSERRGTGTPKKSSKIGRLDCITGKGKHSSQQKSRLMPCIEKWLQQQNIPHQVFQNKGFIRVSVRL
jgi:DNA-nicking Smr family endonuclease